MQKQYSVLMSVYYKEKPEYLQQSINSMLSQTIPTDDFVLVCDGPIPLELEKVIASIQNDSFHVIRLKENVGLGKALNIGMKHCNHELIARMDSDDISRNDRCERELQILDTHSEIDIVSGTVEEFSDSIENVLGRRELPERDSAIKEFAKRRNPFNHPAVMYRKSAVLAAGGYQDFYLLEDYYLWIRMFLNGSNGYNIKEPVLWMRAGSDLYKRRSGEKHLTSEKRLFRYMLDKKFITKTQYFEAIIVRTIAANMPNGLRSIVYERILRK